MEGSDLCSCTQRMTSLDAGNPLGSNDENLVQGEEVSKAKHMEF